MTKQRTTFTLFLGKRGFFPASRIAAARKGVPQALGTEGFQRLLVDSNATRNGAVETPLEGQAYANFRRETEGRFGGVIFRLPTSGDEAGAVAALREGNACRA